MKAFSERLSDAAIEIAFLVKPHNVFYFAGYASVCSGIVAFSDNEPIFCTLWLDAPEAAAHCTLPKVASYLFPEDSLVKRMIKLAEKRNGRPRRIGVEKDVIVLKDYELLAGAFPEAEFVNVTPLVDRLRAIKSPEEIERIRKSASIADEAMNAALGAVRPGATEIEIAAEAEYVMRTLGSERPAFGTFVASGERTLLAHPYASHRKVQPGEPVVIDLGATWQGYASDLCRTTFVGEPTEAQRERLRIIYQAQQAAAASLRDGAMAGEVFDRAYQVMKAHNMGSSLPDDIGYGVGLRQSEFHPMIMKNSETRLAENMVVALLQTTAYQRDTGGLRVEDTFRITASGSEKLTNHIQPLFD
ncbi:MAG: Xaa-Pro peptidase family protein [Deltaproteobacteria bacterium]